MRKWNQRRTEARFRDRTALWIALSTSGVATDAFALDIQLNFESGRSVATGADPAATGLQGLFQYAESFFESVFLDSHNLKVNFWYDNLSGDALGEHMLVAQSNGRETEASIRIDSNSDWFLDPTPSGHGEFSLRQSLWGDFLGPRDDWFNIGSANIPNVFEVAFSGTAPITSPASGRLDMLSVVMHEIGHALGMSAGNLATQAETLDEDYDIDPIFLFGQSLGVETANFSGDDNLDIAHVENTLSLMSPALPTSTRRLPSHADLLAMAAGSSYTTLRLPRMEYYGGGNWNTSGNWAGNRVPDIHDQVNVRSPFSGGNIISTTLSGDASVNSLWIDTATVSTADFTLEVASSVVLAPTETRLIIGSGGRLTADHIEILSNKQGLSDGTIDIHGGTIDLVSYMSIGERAQLVSQQNTNSVFVGSALNNQGTILAMGNSMLQFRLAPLAVLNLGGNGDGRVLADDGDIFFFGEEFSVPQQSLIRVGPGHEVHIEQAWKNWDLIELNGGPTAAERARISGGEVTLEAPIPGVLFGQISASGVAELNAPITMSGGRIEVNSGSELLVKGSASFRGGVIDIGTSGSVRLTQHTIVGDMVTFSGAGKVKNDPGSTLQLEDGANVNVELENDGTLVIGSTPGSASIRQFTQSSLGISHVQLGGYTAGVDHDRLLIQEIASLSGTLQISLFGSFIPLPGDVFDVLSYAARYGAFDEIVNETGLAGLAFTAEYGSTSLRLATSALLSGDADLNGLVGLRDLIALANHWQQFGNWLEGDFDGNGFVDAQDLGLLAQNWQTTVAGTGLIEAAEALGLPTASVPEPNALVMVAACSIIGRRRRR